MIDEKILIEKIRTMAEKDLFDGWTPYAVLHEIYCAILDMAEEGGNETTDRR